MFMFNICDTNFVLLQFLNYENADHDPKASFSSAIKAILLGYFLYKSIKCLNIWELGRFPLYDSAQMTQRMLDQSTARVEITSPHDIIINGLPTNHIKVNICKFI